MNFIAGFLLEVSGLEDFQVWNFLVEFFKKKKNLYFGIYDKDFPVLRFLNFSFRQILKMTHKLVYDHVSNIRFPDELWVSKWFFSFFVLILP